MQMIELVTDKPTSLMAGDVLLLGTSKHKSGHRVYLTMIQGILNERVGIGSHEYKVRYAGLDKSGDDWVVASAVSADHIENFETRKAKREVELKDSQGASADGQGIGEEVKVFVAGSASGRTKPRADTEQPSPAPRPPASSPRKKKQPSSSAAPKVKSDVFEECPHCPPGSGKAKGHKGRHVAKAKAKATLPDGHKPRPAGRAPTGKRWDGTGWVSAGTGEGEAKRPPAPQPGAPRKAKLGSGLSAGASAAATAAAQPPKALNAYALFGAEQRAKGDLPRGAVTEQSKVIGQRWRDVSPGHKARLEEQAKAQKAARQAWLATDTGKAWAEADKVTKQENKRKKEEQELETSAKMSAEASWIAARRKDKKVRLSPSPTPQHLTMPAEQ